MVAPGEIYAHDEFYEDEKTGKLLPKYLMILAAPRKNDIVYRLLTSRQNSRPKDPCCYHGNPLPGYFLGEQLGGPLAEPTWLDLRKLQDYDADTFSARAKDGSIRLVLVLPTPRLRDILNCAAAADDTSTGQERCIRDVVAQLPP
jgi:hypothetical protein